ncbi:HNH endonuclease [Flavobacterium gelatinilyticum]|uniref:HNH endonuclease n=1 Tax=Flavobacterium gelatinilyticum TaxID=3003260 RepID=UPI00248114CE|nr:HNH endonuclease [Flavobacterium gelatinilyticum]
MPQNDRRLWSKEELILAFNLYLKISFGKTHSGNPKIIELANLINRTPASVVMRLGNFASIDPFHINRGISGLKNGMNQVQPIWDEFFNNQEELIFLSEEILAQKQHTSIEKKYENILSDIKNLEGKDVYRTVKTRVNQSVFREMILSNYNSKCAISGIDLPELLLASHIIPWSQNEEHRLNPENGICLSALYDKGLVGINLDHKIILSDALKKKRDNEYFNKYFYHLENQQIIRPQKYLPKKEFLEHHLDTIFNK